MLRLLAAPSPTTASPSCRQTRLDHSHDIESRRSASLDPSPAAEQLSPRPASRCRPGRRRRRAPGARARPLMPRRCRRRRHRRRSSRRRRTCSDQLLLLRPRRWRPVAVPRRARRHHPGRHCLPPSSTTRRSTIAASARPSAGGPTLQTSSCPRRQPRPSCRSRSLSSCRPWATRSAPRRSRRARTSRATQSWRPQPQQRRARRRPGGWSAQGRSTLRRARAPPASVRPIRASWSRSWPSC